ncbi:hypothetical protein E8E13_002830 [Curvularia kusanoi]|uniref:Uncharacterized protein n=1 Tax=Curvularia kusanoi TaxID=90978 RepID=A0A9P4T8X5_CURKU|nr:hypothetical protein E8E13_002830 [Curvularia kusanoi]
MDVFLDTNSALHGWGLVLLAATVLTLVAGTVRKYFRKPAVLTRQPYIPSKLQKENQEDAYYTIEPLPTLDISTEEPIKARPFKPKYHMTMALENSTISDLLTMDNTYTPRLTLRRHLLTTHPSETIASNPTADPAVLELYTWLTQTYLPLRFPTIFTLSSTNLKNTCTGDSLPLTPSSATEALHLLGAHIDTEFLILLPSTQPEDEGKYRLEAFVTCFPSGFRTRDKLGLLLAEIHAPVPHYRQKLERSMDRFFAALGVGRVVKRWNWTVSTTGGLGGREGGFADYGAQV